MLRWPARSLLLPPRTRAAEARVRLSWRLTDRRTAFVAEVSLPASADILVLGGGPTGLSLLSELLHQDARGRHLLVEANVAPCGGSVLPRGQGILASTLELWARWGDGGVPGRVTEQRLLPARFEPVFLSWDSRRQRPGPAPEPQRLASSLTAWGGGERVPQARYEAVLRSHLASEIPAVLARTRRGCHASTHYGWRAVSLRRDGDAWAVSLVPSSEDGVLHYAAGDGGSLDHDHKWRRKQDGLDSETVRVVRASTIVGCDGGKSLVRKTLGTNFEGLGALGVMLSPFFRSTSLYRKLRAQFDGTPEGMFYCFKKEGCPSAFIGVVSEDTFFGQVLYDSRSEIPQSVLDANEAGDRSRLAELAVNELENNCDCDFVWDVTPEEGYLWTPYNLCAESWMSEDLSVFIAGDAAHLLSPAGAFGMNGGVADAVNLGWKLAARQNGCLGGRGGAMEKAVVESYQSERKRVWQRYSAYQQSAVAEDRRSGRREAGPPYEFASLGPSSRSPVLGERATDVVLKSGAHLHTLLAECKGYTLLLLERSESAYRCAERFKQEGERIGASVLVRVVDSDDNLLRVYGGCTGDTAFVFRPDQVLAWRGTSEDLLGKDGDSFPIT